MANTPQAKKRIRRNERRAVVNGNKEAAKAALASAQPELARGVAKGVLHKNTASRKFSRLTKRLAALA